MSQGICEADERHFIGDIVAKQPKYGSTVKNVFREPRYIQHKLQPSDTLQGLALKYNVSMERIKRANNLWTSDSLFSRSHLNIPIEPSIAADSSISKPHTEATSTKNKLIASKSGLYDELNCDDINLEESPSSSSPLENGSKLRLRKDKNVKENVCSTSQKKGEKSNGYNSKDSEEGEGEESVADFLIRIDSYIAKSKNQVNSIQKKSRLTSTYSDDDLFKSSIDKSSSSSYLRRQNSARNGVLNFGRPLEDSNDKPQPFIMTQGRKVASSLKKLEKQQDELFEL